MNVTDAVRNRRSIRDILPQAFDPQTLHEVPEVAIKEMID